MSGWPAAAVSTAAGRFIVTTFTGGGFMAGKDWQVTLDFTAGERIDEDTLFEIIEEFADRGASAALDPDGMGGSVTVSVTADCGPDALSDALDMVAASETLRGVEVTGFEVTDWDRARRRNREPLFPKVVGYAEIARMTGVSRQRAAMFPRIESFPMPVIETSQGPLYSESAVAAWAATRRSATGRPKASA